MKKIFILLIVGIALGTTLSAQRTDEIPDVFQETTYPVDSCLYFMDPMSLLITQEQTLQGTMLGYRTRFRSSSSAMLDYSFSGRGRFLIDANILPDGIGIAPGNQLQILASLPDAVHDPNSAWLGGDIPFPAFLSGFIQKIGDQMIDPPIPIGLHVIQYEIIQLSE